MSVGVWERRVGSRRRESIRHDHEVVCFLRVARLRARLPTRVEYSPVRLALVTSRDSPAELRVIKTLREWGVYVDLAFFLGGVDKGPVLKAFNPHIFFDHQDVHVEAAAGQVPTGKVLYSSGSKLRELQEERAMEDGK